MELPLSSSTISGARLFLFPYSFLRNREQRGEIIFFSINVEIHWDEGCGIARKVEREVYSRVKLYIYGTKEWKVECNSYPRKRMLLN